MKLSPYQKCWKKNTGKFVGIEIETVKNETQEERSEKKKTKNKPECQDQIIICTLGQL